MTRRLDRDQWHPSWTVLAVTRYGCDVLQTLVKRAKHGDDSLDLDRTLASNIAARSRFKETDLDADAEYDYDAGLDL